ncbi:uncharacterized protein LOC106518354 isoform X3 [Austrofundulus limnaeus]|uniref:Uncharacterized protein LOC106518354 isoform X3 n=1 Tax=Austrofundulus limnaeus TaxID=52670 RepID=A0A2I4BBD3_AUSLI|nr:PREDICTED: uncharacterized protein LOC106518354 isoform X3 [Austrofundulus limnaeus]
MSDTTRLGEFKTFLTEHFTTLAVEVFTEVENIVGACFEENKRLRSMLHMVLSPEIKLHKIDVTPYTEPSIREEPAEPNTRLTLTQAAAKNIKQILKLQSQASRSPPNRKRCYICLGLLSTNLSPFAQQNERPF